MHRVDDDDEGNAIAMSDLLKGMYDKDPGAVKKLLRSAMRVGEEMRKRWTNREKEDDEYKAETMRQLQEEWAAQAVHPWMSRTGSSAPWFRRTPAFPAEEGRAKASLEATVNSTRGATCASTAGSLDINRESVPIRG